MSNIQVASCPQCHRKPLTLLRKAARGYQLLCDWSWSCPACGWGTKWNVMFAEMRDLAEWVPFGAEPKEA